MNTKDDVRGTSIGYAINLIMDYGNGRQVTISGTLPLNATLDEMNAELDKLRLATNRQQSLVSLRDVENTVEMAKKTVVAVKAIVAEYEKAMEAEMQKLADSPESKQTRVKSQIDNMRTQAANYKLTKNEELMRAESDVAKGELMLERLRKEVGTEG